MAVRMSRVGSASGRPQVWRRAREVESRAMLCHGDRSGRMVVRSGLLIGLNHPALESTFWTPSEVLQHLVTPERFDPLRRVA
jgi:hypothetical protein